jgi:hypothetical protein
MAKWERASRRASDIARGRGYTRLPVTRWLLYAVCAVAAVSFLAALSLRTAEPGTTIHGSKGPGVLLESDRMPDPSFVISGDALGLLYPGVGRPIDLAFTNPGARSIKIPSGAITITITSTKAGCSAYPNFVIRHGLRTSVTVAAHSHRSLSGLHVPRRDWPVIAMVTTHVTQDACEGANLTLHYRGYAS